MGNRTLTAELKTNKQNLLDQVDQVLQQQKELGKGVEDFKKQLTPSDLGSSLSRAEEVNGISYITGILKGVDGEDLRNLTEETRDCHAPIVIALASVMEGKVFSVPVVTRELTKQVQTGKLIGKVAETAGGGEGGCPNFAQAGGKDPPKAQEATGVVE